MLHYLRARAIDGLEIVEEGLYRRTVTHEGLTGSVTIEHRPVNHCLLATICFPSVRALQAIVSRIRHQFDVAADIEAIAAHLSKDEALAPLIDATIGAIGGTTMGMMTRTAKGHTGRPLVATPAEVVAYLLVEAAAVVRVFGGLVLPSYYVGTVVASGLCFAAAYALYAILYWPILTRPRLDGRPG